ncbi:hypothetical protein ScPMuIL_001270 [Solemya velum]
MDVREKDIVRKPDISWGPKVFTLKEIAEKFTLPRVVLCNPGSSSVPLDHFNFDFKQPIMLYKRRTVKKTRACSLAIDPIKKVTCAVGDSLMIPDDYKGWFFPVPPPKNNESTVLVPVWESIEEVANSNIKRFLIGGSTPINVLRITDQSGFHQRQCLPGDILRKGKTYTAQAKKRKTFWKKSSIVEENFLKCADEQDRVVLISHETKGTFYPVEADQSGDGTVLMRIKDVREKKELPCIVRLMHGRLPPNPCAFTGNLQLMSAREQTSIVGATVFNLKNIMLEFDIDSHLNFFVADDTPDLLQSKGYRGALNTCSKEGHMFVTNIKIIHNLENRTERNLTSEKTNTINEIALPSTNLPQPKLPPKKKVLPPPPPLEHKTLCRTDSSTENYPTACPGSSPSFTEYVDMNRGGELPPAPAPCYSSGSSGSSHGPTMTRRRPHDPNNSSGDVDDDDDEDDDNAFMSHDRPLSRQRVEQTFSDDWTDRNLRKDDTYIYMNLQGITQQTNNPAGSIHASGSFDATSLSNMSYKEPGGHYMDQCNTDNRNSLKVVCDNSGENERDSGIHVLEDLQSMGADELCNRLGEMGVGKKTLRYLSDRHIDGCVMSSMYETDFSLEEHFPAGVIPKGDREIISKFINKNKILPITRKADVALVTSTKTHDLKRSSSSPRGAVGRRCFPATIRASLTIGVLQRRQRLPPAKTGGEREPDSVIELYAMDFRFFHFSCRGT